MTSILVKRLQKELAVLRTSPIPGVVLEETDRLDTLYMIVSGTEGTLYQGEVFRLRFTFPDDYPISAPEVVFIGRPPIHPHIYGNGHICLSILYDQWSPAMSVQSICLSIISMLSSCKKKEAPVDNDSYVMRVGTASPKKTKWWFHDDTC